MQHTDLQKYQKSTQKKHPWKWSLHGSSQKIMQVIMEEAKKI